MTLRPLPRWRLDRVAPQLLRDAALVALVPATDDDWWAAETAWNVARAAASAEGRQGERRAVALVDLSLEAPLLHRPKGRPQTPGIADAVASDAPLSDVAQDVDGVYFLAAGNGAIDPSAVRGTSRWRRLQAGFRTEGALLLVCLPADRLAEFGADLDGVLVLAPDGVDLGSPAGRALLAARDRGVELLGVVRERWSAARPGQALLEASHSRWARPSFAGLAVAAAVVAAVLALASRTKGTTARESFGTAQAAESATSPAAAADAPSPPPVIPVLPLGQGGAWTLQLASYGAVERAVAHVDRLLAAGVPAFLSPIAPDASGTVWFRVLAGAYGTRELAVAARRGLWRDGLAARGEGTPLLAPYSLALARPADAARVRAVGLAVARLGDHGPVVLGAFERPEQAGAAIARLASAAIPTTLITRRDRTP